jgi:hypothetical protein
LVQFVEVRTLVTQPTKGTAEIQNLRVTKEIENKSPQKYKSLNIPSKRLSKKVFPSFIFAKIVFLTESKIPSEGRKSMKEKHWKRGRNE